jgi:putative oxidoreductase
VVEVFVALAVALGAWTRPLALLLALYTLGTGLIGHPFWTMEGVARYGNAINFHKNVSIIGGFVLLYVTGPGQLLGRRAAWPVRRAAAPLTLQTAITLTARAVRRRGQCSSTGSTT